MYSLEIIEGNAFDPVSNIESVKDSIDGDIKQSDDKEITKDGYIIESDVNTDQSGEYTVKVMSCLYSDTSSIALRSASACTSAVCGNGSKPFCFLRCKSRQSG